MKCYIITCLDDKLISKLLAYCRRHSVMTPTRNRLVPASILLMAGCESVLAQGLDSHVHGNAELNVVLMGQQLQVEFFSPAINLLGFERAPGNDEETALLNGAITQLLDGGWLIGDSLANCQLSTQAFEAPVYEEQSHDHDEEHDHASHAGGGDAHSNFRVQYLYDCPTSPARQLRIIAFDFYSGIETLTVQWIAERQQGYTQLTANNPVLVLE